MKVKAEKEKHDFQEKRWRGVKKNGNTHTPQKKKKKKKKRKGKTTQTPKKKTKKKKKKGTKKKDKDETKKKEKKKKKVLQEIEQTNSSATRYIRAGEKGGWEKCRLPIKCNHEKREIQPTFVGKAGLAF